MKPVLIAALASLLAACAATRFDVPALSQPGQGASLPGKIVWHDLLTDTPSDTKAFYGELFEWTFEPIDVIGANYTLIRHKGRLIGGMVDQNQLPNEADISQWVVVLSVGDVEAASRAVAGAGGKVFTPPTSLGGRGTISVVADPDGAVFAMLQTDGEDPADDLGKIQVGGFLWDELWSADAPAAVSFYQGLTEFNVEERQAGTQDSPVTYNVLSSQGVPRLGIRQRPVDDIRPAWASYLRVANEPGIRDIVGRTGELGGRVLMPVTRRPAGGFVAVIAGPSGAAIALQTWPLDGELTIASGGEK